MNAHYLKLPCHVFNNHPLIVRGFKDIMTICIGIIFFKIARHDFLSINHIPLKITLLSAGMFGLVTGIERWCIGHFYKKISIANEVHPNALTHIKWMILEILIATLASLSLLSFLFFNGMLFHLFSYRLSFNDAIKVAISSWAVALFVQSFLTFYHLDLKKDVIIVAKSFSKEKEMEVRLEAKIIQAFLKLGISNKTPLNCYYIKEFIYGFFYVVHASLSTPEEFLNKMDQLKIASIYSCFRASFKTILGSKETKIFTLKPHSVFFKMIANEIKKLN